MQKFPDKVKHALMKTGHVQKITSSQVVFTPEFKIKALEMNLAGRNPFDIFLSLGVDPAFFLPEFPKKCISRWKSIYNREGEEGLREEKRGKGATGRPKRSYDPTDIKSLQEKIALLEAENYILKKLQALEAEHEKKKRSR